MQCHVHAELHDIVEPIFGLKCETDLYLMKFNKLVFCTENEAYRFMGLI